MPTVAGPRAAGRRIQTLLRAFWAIILLAVIAQSAQAQRPVAEESVRIVFTSLKHAMMGRDGATAARYIDDEMIAFYERVRRAALQMPKQNLLKERLFFQIAVLSTRHYFGKEDIDRIGGRDLFAKFVTVGEAGAAKTIEALTIGKVEPGKDGLSATADLRLEGRTDRFRMRFFIQRGSWRMQLSHLFDTAARELEERIGIRPATPTEVTEIVIVRDMFPAMAQQSGRPVSAEIWTPLAQRK